MKEAIRAMAAELGFDDCRFANATPPENAARLSEWIATGQHGEMAYLARTAHKRVNPQEVLPGARSVVCVALNYGTDCCMVRGASSSGDDLEPTRDLTRNTQHGRLARYAQHADYHDVMGERLRQLAERVNELAGDGTRSLWYVDTGPILEREFAQRAGIGFVGKHTNLISRRWGNWILLGEILTTAEIEPDTPEKNRCGSCSRCIAACPTGAITAPFQLDARLCISYLTIELKGTIPEHLRPAVGNRIFGCDDCLEVCPWNRFASEASYMRQYRREDMETPNLLELLSLDEATFKTRFRETPISRSKRRGLLRNVCVALGNTADKEALPALQAASRDPEPLIAEHALWAIREIEKRQSRRS